MSARRALRRAATAAVASALTLLLVPDSTPQPVTLSLTTVETAKKVDFGEDIVWILVLGSDARPGQTVTEGNSDAIHLVGIDGRNGRAVGIGVPRDTYLDMPVIGRDRISRALADGGSDVAAQVVGDLVGIQPDFVLVTGFEGFISMMSTVGPIQVVATEKFTEGDTVVVKGRNNFEPDQVLDFVRHRKTLVEGDFARSAHQQEAMSGTLQQLLVQEDDEGFMERATLAALTGLETDLAPIELYRLAQAVTQVDRRNITSCVLPATPGTAFGDASVVYVDPEVARRIGADAADDAILQDDCEP